MELKIRDLRKALYLVDNQEMTVKELRSVLFAIDEQDEELDERKLVKSFKELKI